MPVFLSGVRQPVDRIGSYDQVARNTVDATAATPISVFTVTGDVVLRIVAVCKIAPTTSGSITVELGVTGATAVLIAQIADATDLAQHEIWHDATPTTTLDALSVLKEVIVSNGQDVILTTTGTLTAGTIAFTCFWTALSSDGAVTPA